MIRLALTILLAFCPVVATAQTAPLTLDEVLR